VTTLRSSNPGHSQICLGGFIVFGLEPFSLVVPDECSRLDCAVLNHRLNETSFRWASFTADRSAVVMEFGTTCCPSLRWYLPVTPIVCK
jgi:tRNA G37 N-methylase TrmD